MRCLIYAIHGIDSTDESSFVDIFKSWMATQMPEATVMTHEYLAGPLPLINNWLLDPRHADEIVDDILFNAGSLPVYFVMHSNGNVIGWLAAQKLMQKGKKIAGMIFIAGAINGDVHKNGILDAVNAKNLGFGSAYCSHDDDVVDGYPSVQKGFFKKAWSAIWGVMMAPYGSLGTTGWMYNGKTFEQRPSIVTKWFSGGHSGYFLSNQINGTFEDILSDIKNL